MECKNEGKCPFCNESITPLIIEKNVFRRDKCQCPNCNGIIYICRGLFCQDYAKGGEIYDDELCQPCTSKLVEQLKKLPGQMVKKIEEAKKKTKK
ncbi:hypothetical protein ABN057_07070 [Providencia alcalifaciens]|uniref:hypothetical protein n=1 Tax=Providencia alcalifaciens TaxID=126385 RepID=UPI0032D9F95D